MYHANARMVVGPVPQARGHLRSARADLHIRGALWVDRPICSICSRGLGELLATRWHHTCTIYYECAAYILSDVRESCDSDEPETMDAMLYKARTISRENYDGSAALWWRLVYQFDISAF